ncbi:MAG: quinone-dependent dihydroorotate dehydrogenase [Rhizobiaceae bacterium]
MNPLLDWLGRNALFALDPETAHGLSIAALKSGLPLAPRTMHSPLLETHVAGLTFPNPLGLAAGYDKNAEIPDAALKLGFGFAEVGTVTPLSQSGNPRPRIFRLTADQAVINRLGFNNEGHASALKRLAGRAARPGVVGVNIGANKDSADRMGDYEAGVRRFAPLASYLTVNVSSPNTPGLRDLQARTALEELLQRVLEARSSLPVSKGGRTPMFLKIAPDLDESALDDIAAALAARPVEGLIVSNTTVSRPPLESRAHAGEAGGLSGRPLFNRSTAVLARMRRRLGPEAVIVGAGGVDDPDTALEKIRAGADLVQLYTGMIYQGPVLPGRIVAGMARFAEREGLKRLTQIRDSRADHWAAQPIG